MSESRQTVAGAYAKIAIHEAECAGRYASLESGIADVKQGVKWLIGLVCTVASVLILGLGSVTWGYVQRDLEKAHEAAVQQATGD